jgi:hypothetical protein
LARIAHEAQAAGVRVRCCAGPNQHLMRQPLLLEAILSNIQKDHPGHAAFRSALDKIKDVVMKIDESKEFHESRLRLVELQQRLRGEFDDLVVPARKLVREGSVQEVARKTIKGKASSALDDNLEVTKRSHSSLSRVAGTTGHYAFLCNDSLWFCEVLRGNKYKVVHTFRFKAPAGPAAPDKTTQPAASADVQVSPTGPASFWVSDSALSVHLRLAGGEDAETWVHAIEEATQVAAPDLSETSYQADSPANDVASPAEVQLGLPAASAGGAGDSVRKSESRKRSPSDASSVPASMPKPSARYLSQYRARHNLGRASMRGSTGPPTIAEPSGGE